MRIIVALLAVLLAGVPAPVSGQGTPPPGGQRQRMELERRFQMGLHRAIQRELNLGEEEARRLQGTLQSFQEERTALSRSQASLRHRLRDPGLQDLAEAEARALLEEMVQVQERELELYRSEQQQLLQILSPVQLVRLYRLRDDMGRRLQQVRQRGQGGGGGPGGQGMVRSQGPGGFPWTHFPLW